MTWPELSFGRHAGKTLVQVVLTDPDWLFWAAELGVLAAHHVPRATELCRKAQSIRIPDGPRGPRVADYVLHWSGQLSHVEVGYPGEMDRSEDRGVVRRDAIDLSFAREFAEHDKLGAKRILEALRRHVFKRMGWERVTKERAESFFDDYTNFILPAR